MYSNIVDVIENERECSIREQSLSTIDNLDWDLSAIKFIGLLKNEI